jgi:hypothetical protein
MHTATKDTPATVPTPAIRVKEAMATEEAVEVNFEHETPLFTAGPMEGADIPV